MILWPVICRLARRLSGRRQIGQVLWLTGLPSSGKTTIGQAIAAILEGRGHDVEFIDEEHADGKFPQAGISKEEQDAHVRDVASIAAQLEKQDVIVICALVSPYREAREAVRMMCDNFMEIHVHCPLSVCVRRDSKGLYRKAYAGLIENFTGVSNPYEVPLLPELYLRTHRQTLGVCIQNVLDAVRR